MQTDRILCVPCQRFGYTRLHLARDDAELRTAEQRQRSSQLNPPVVPRALNAYALVAVRHALTDCAFRTAAPRTPRQELPRRWRVRSTRGRNAAQYPSPGSSGRMASNVQPGDRNNSMHIKVQ